MMLLYITLHIDGKKKKKRFQKHFEMWYFFIIFMLHFRKNLRWTSVSTSFYLSKYINVFPKKERKSRQDPSRNLYCQFVEETPYVLYRFNNFCHITFFIVPHDPYDHVTTL